MRVLLIVLLSSIFFLLSFSSLNAQNGTLRGNLTDKNTGDVISFANVLIKETGGGFTTDLDGAFSHQLPAGAYTLLVNYIGYADKTIESVEIKPNEVTVLNIVISEAGEVMQEVVVTAKQLTNTENALVSIQRKSINVVNGVSSQSFSRTGDSNAGAAIKRVTGVSVEDGKYVYVRGLGDRYTKTILNGMAVPGLDPDRNSIRMNIFPTNVIDNIMVTKTFSPDLPGDFTGGVVDITTKDFPDQKTSSFSLGFGYNPQMNFNSNFITGTKSSTDFLGFDNGSRALPLTKTSKIPAPINSPVLTDMTSQFSKELATERQMSLGDYNLGFSLGNQLNKEKIDFGYNLALNYKNEADFYEGAQYNNFIKSSDVNETALLSDNTSVGDLGINNVMLSGLIGGAMKFDKHKFKVNLMHLQNGKSKAGAFTRNSFIRNSNTLVSDNMEYTESGITNLLISGKHSTVKKMNINWKLSPTYSTIQDKDIKITPFLLNDDNTLTIEPSEGAQPTRLWRNLNELNFSGKIDVDKKVTIAKREVEFKAGVLNSYKTRDYEILNYVIGVRGQSLLNINGDPNQLLAPEHIWTPESMIGSYVKGNFEPTNSYNAIQNTAAGYVMANFDIVKNLKINTGLRVEQFNHFYTGQNNAGTIIYNNEKILDNLNFMPSVNLIYDLDDEMKLRGSFSQTVARPSFKEASIAQIYDGISDQTFIGNIELQQTDISNFDLRWELYKQRGQLMSVSGFYKAFTNPIELVAFSSSAPNDLQPRNVGNAQVTGMEFEFRKDLNFIHPALQALQVGANLTYVYSQVEMDRSPNGEYKSRVLNARTGETISGNRPMQGQAPYIINSYVNYLNKEKGWEANVSYNVQGSSLAVVGMGLNPDVYSKPFHNLSARISKQLGSNDRMKWSLGVSNILGSSRVQEYQSYGAENQVSSLLNPGTSFSVGLNYRFF